MYFNATELYTQKMVKMANFVLCTLYNIYFLKPGTWSSDSRGTTWSRAHQQRVALTVPISDQGHKLHPGSPESGWGGRRGSRERRAGTGSHMSSSHRISVFSVKSVPIKLWGKQGHHIDSSVVTNTWIQ